MGKSVIWGCPSSNGYIVASFANSLKGDVNRNYPPYAMNRWPTFTSTYPDPAGPVQFPTPNATYMFEGSSTGSWYKLGKYTTPAEKALLGDARALYPEARAPLSSAQIPGQCLLQNQATYAPSGARQTMFDFYRHGNYPPVQDGETFSPKGGRVAFNILYADMHVTTAIDRETGYKSLRMRFPL